ncbi:transglutaminase-like cysteine peptidase [Campylobacter curvus]|uniref:transglutaminase-like cysteine peptidase n=1 Tax=Campylobacter curvus TaxID=200 RepID=UPI00146FF407|nr:transglutaminase-like cysteine peptidase [Campylobacter curvus]
MTKKVVKALRVLSFGALLSIFTCGLVADFIKSSTIAKMGQIYGEDARRRASALNALMASLQNASVQEKLVKVNDFFNALRWTTDMEVWGKKDYWATRMEFLGKGAGDCEDYVIAKYFTLKQLGVPTDKLYFTYVKALKYNQAHMVLSYYETPKSIPLILDNINGKIKIATQRTDLLPVYSFNGDSLYLAKQEGLGQVVPGGNKKQNPKWLELIDKMQKEDL